MKTVHNLTCGLIAAVLSVGALPTIAEDDMTGTGMGDTTRTIGPTGTPETTGQGGSASRAGMVTDPSHPRGISEVVFIEKATEKNFAIINAANLALEKESGVVEDPEIHGFAQQMIEEHKQLNQQLAQLAADEQLEVSDSATLLDRAQRMVLSVRGGESFEEAYANNQVADHQELVDLFTRAANSDHGALSRFAASVLPKLEGHLEQARGLHPDARNAGGQD